MRIRRWTGLLPELRAGDAVVIGVLLVMVTISALALGRWSGNPEPTRIVVTALVAGTLQTVPALWRRERPIGALVVFAASVPQVWALAASPATWTWAVLVFGVVRRSRPVPGGVALVATTLLAPLLAGIADRPTDPATALGIAVGLLLNVGLVLVAAAAVAVVARGRAARIAARRWQEERDRLADALAAQRDRLAGDLRDLVAVRVERVVAGVRALPATATDRDARLTVVAAEARAALAGMRRALHLLRAPTSEPDAPAADPPAPPNPRWLPTRGGAALAAVAAGLVAASAAVAAVAIPHARPGPLADTLALVDVDLSRPAGLLPLLVQVGALAWWRRAPLPALVVATAGSTAAALLHSTHLVTEAAWSILVFGAGLGAGTVASAVTVAACSTVVLVTTLTTDVPAAVDQGQATWVLSYVLVPAIWGLGVLQRRAAAAEARRAADRSAERALREVRAQRLGLARDLHDVLAHELSALVVTLHAARLDPDPDTLAAIDEAGERIAAALATLLEGAPGAARPVLDVLDTDAVGALAGPVRDAGLPVEVEVVGDAPADRPEADVLAARIVTEALTNALRHAGPTPTRVSVRHGDDGVTVEVVDDGVRPGHRAAREGSGLGLVGMRERAALVGGTVEAGPWGPGWRVLAHLPRRAAGLLDADADAEPAGSRSPSR
ncbi:sensor histidine kinase [Actinomycetospora sp. C-140]